MRQKIDRELLRDIEPTGKAFEIFDTDVKGFVVRVTASGTLTYIVRYTNSGGKQCRYPLNKSFPTTSVSAAREEARILLGDIAAGNDPAQAKQVERKQAVTLEQFIDDHYSDWLIANTKAGAVRIAGIKSAFRKHLDKPLTEFDALTIEKWRAQRHKAGISASTTNRSITALRGLFSRALEWGAVTSHPLSSVKMLQEPSGKARWLSDDEEKRLRAALDAREERDRAGRENANKWRTERNYELLPDLRNMAFVDHLKPMILLSLNTGVRQGEALKLRWDAIDLAGGMLTVIDDNSKSGTARHIPLNDEALATLKAWRKQSHEALVFPGKDGVAMSEIKTAWGRLLKLAGIENFRWHDMRHHFASRLVMAGVDLNTVRELLGHSDLKMTLRYAHLAPEHKAAAVQKLMRNI